jgi:hypothetical protein
VKKAYLVFSWLTLQTHTLITQEAARLRDEFKKLKEEKLKAQKTDA